MSMPMARLLRYPARAGYAEPRDNIIQASWMAMTDALEYKLVKVGVEPFVAAEPTESRSSRPSKNAASKSNAPPKTTPPKSAPPKSAPPAEKLDR